MDDATYTIAEDGKSITCKRCGLTSHHLGDVASRYCGRCHVFHDDEYRARMLRAKTQIAPGIWIDQNGCGHVSIPDVLKHLGLEDTPENHELAKRVFADATKRNKMSPVFRKTANDPGEAL